MILVNQEQRRLQAHEVRRNALRIRPGQLDSLRAVGVECVTLTAEISPEQGQKRSLLRPHWPSLLSAMFAKLLIVKCSSCSLPTLTCSLSLTQQEAKHEPHVRVCFTPKQPSGCGASTTAVRKSGFEKRGSCKTFQETSPRNTSADFLRCPNIW